jgi:mRNA interferase HigB
MRIISRKRLRDYWEQHKEVQKALEAWYADVKNSVWHNTSEIKTIYQTASFLEDNRVVFNICGNNYRIVVRINYDYQLVYIRFVGSHTEYDRIDATKI